MRHLPAPEEGTVWRVRRGELQTMRAILPGSKWRCLLLHIVFIDALTEVMKVYPYMKLKVLWTISQSSWTDETLAGVAEQDPRAMRRDVEEKGLKLSITKRERDGKSKVIASCSYLEEVAGIQQKRRSRPCEQRGDTRVDPRTRTKHLAAQEKARKKL